MTFVPKRSIENGQLNVFEKMRIGGLGDEEVCGVKFSFSVKSSDVRKESLRLMIVVWSYQRRS